MIAKNDNPNQIETDRTKHSNTLLAGGFTSLNDVYWSMKKTSFTDGFIRKLNKVWPFGRGELFVLRQQFWTFPLPYDIKGMTNWLHTFRTAGIAELDGRSFWSSDNNLLEVRLHTSPLLQPLSSQTRQWMNISSRTPALICNDCIKRDFIQLIWILASVDCCVGHNCVRTCVDRSDYSLNRLARLYTSLLSILASPIESTHVVLFLYRLLVRHEI